MTIYGHHRDDFWSAGHASPGHRSVCPRCARLRARAACTMGSLSSTCHGWSTSCTPFARTLCDPAPVPVCAAGGMHTRVVRACAPRAHALPVACACCACPCCACPCCALSCWACGVLEQCSSKSCGLRSSTLPTPLSGPGAETKRTSPVMVMTSTLPSTFSVTFKFLPSCLTRAQCLSMRGFFTCPVLLLNALYI